MGVALDIVLEEEIPEYDTFVNGKALARAEQDLNRIAQELGVRPLMDFFSADPEEVLSFIQAEHEATGQTPDNLPDIPPEEWFSATDGLATVQALYVYIREHPDTLKDADSVLQNLEEYMQVLQKAVAVGVRWHLGVDF